MKYLKILGLAAVAAAALMAFAGSASATVLCNNNTSTTACTSKVTAGTAIKSELNGGSATLETTGGTVLVTCTGSTVAGTVENAGGSAATVGGKITALTWSGCSKEVKTLVNGELEIHHIAGTDNGTLTAKNTQVTVNGLFENESCIYGAGTGTDLGTLVGGAPATLSISALVKRQTGSGALCPAETRWTASYKVTAPNPLYVAAA